MLRRSLGRRLDVHRTLRWLGIVFVAVASTLPQLAAAAPAPRSAQGDCSREAGRRGFTVLSTSNFRQYSDGWSMDMLVRNQQGRQSSGSCFVETSSGVVSLYGFGWDGQGAGGSGLFEFNCASVDDKYRECQLPVDGRARLVKRYSKSQCIEGRSWGQRRDRVWVDHGCRAKFEVARGQGGGGGWGGGGAAVADRACVDEARRQGYRVVGTEGARPVPGGYVKPMRLRRGQGPGPEYRAACRYTIASGRVRLDFSQ